MDYHHLKMRPIPTGNIHMRNMTVPTLGATLLLVQHNTNTKLPNFMAGRINTQMQ